MCFVNIVCCSCIYCVYMNGSNLQHPDIKKKQLQQSLPIITLGHNLPLAHCMLGYKIASLKKEICIIWKNVSFVKSSEKKVWYR